MAVAGRDVTGPTNGGTTSAGAGGSGGEAASASLAGEVIATLCEKLWYLDVIDDDHIYEGCFESMTVDFNQVEQFTLRQLTDSGTQLLATSKTSLKMIAMDATGYFVQQFASFDDNMNSWGGDITRLDFETTQLVPFAAAKNPNATPSILLQTDDQVVISQPSQTGLSSSTKYFASATVNEKATDKQRVVLESIEGALLTSWLEGENVAFVVRTEEGPFVYRGALSSGTAARAEALPNLCQGVARAKDGFLAICGDESELVRIDMTGAIVARFAKGVPYWEDVYDFDRVYWSDYDPLGSKLYAATDAGAIAELQLEADSFVKAITPEFAYVYSITTRPYALRRIPLTDIE